MLETLAERISPRILRAPARLDPAAARARRVLRRARRRPSTCRSTGGSRGASASTVLRRLVAEIGYGQTATYGRSPSWPATPGRCAPSARACATNPLPVVVPCHRVVRSDGGMGGYLGGLDAKRLLLDLERAA